jgi:hypothetical protein
MAHATDLGLFSSRSLENTTFHISSHFSTGNNSDILDQQEPMDIDLPQSTFGRHWLQLPAPVYPQTPQDWENYRSTFTELY